MNDLLFALLAAAALALQYFLSSRHNAYFGAIIPLLFISGLTWMLFTDRVESPLKYVLILGVILLFLLEQWSRGRKALRRNTQKELDRMNRQDIN